MTLYTAALSESVSVSDSLSPVRRVPTTVSESVGVSDGVAAVRTCIAALSESASASDLLGDEGLYIPDIRPWFRCEPNDPSANLYFGKSTVIIDEDTVAFGCSSTSPSTGYDGAVYIFRRIPGGWTQNQKITRQYAGESFGFSLAASGERLLVGAPGYSNRLGRAYVFLRGSDGQYTLEDTITYDGSSNHDFGYAVALDDANDRAVVCTIGGGNGGTGAGRYYVRSGSTWSFKAHIVAPITQAGSLMGYDASIDGDFIALSWAFLDYAGLANVGAIVLYKIHGNYISHVRTVFPPTAWRAELRFARSLVLKDGVLVTYGDYDDDDTYDHRGKALVYKLDDLLVPKEHFIRFNGTDHRCNGPNALGFDYDDAFSIAAWFRSTDTGGGYIFSKIDSSPKGYGLQGDFIWIGNGSNSIFVKTTAHNFDGMWHHIVVTYDGSGLASGVTIYIDGVSVATTTLSDTLSSSSITNSQVTNIACLASISTYFEGDIKHVAVYSKELSAAEAEDVFESIALDELSTSGDLEAWWKLGPEDRPPYTFYDSSGNARHMAGYLLDADDDVFADYAGESFITLDGDNEYCQANLYTDFNYEYTDAFSIVFRARYTNTSSEYIISKYDNGYTKGYGIVAAGNGNYYTNFRSSASNMLMVATVDTNCNDGEWHHIVMTYDGSGDASGVTFYVDGSSVSMSVSHDALNGSIQNTERMLIGRRSPSPVYFTGDLNHIAIYGKELSSAEVTAIYNNQDNLNLLDTADDLDGWWPINVEKIAYGSWVFDNSGNGKNLAVQGNVPVPFIHEPQPAQVIEGYAEDDNYLRLPYHSTQLFDGEYLLIRRQDIFTGTPSENSRIIVHQYVAGTFVETGIALLAPDVEANDYFGIWGAAVKDGRIVVTALGWDDPSYSNSGAAYVYNVDPSHFVDIVEDVEATWIEALPAPFCNKELKLEPDDPSAGLEFGRGACWIDEYTIAVGACEDPGSAIDNGEVYILSRVHGGWQQIQKISSPDSGACFGYRVDSSGDWLLVGGPGWGTGLGRRGRAYVYKKGVDGQYTYKQTFSGSNGEWARFGYAVSIDGDSLVIGEPGEDTFKWGAVYVYTVSGDTWSLEQKIDAPADDGESYFGTSVAIDDTNDTLAVGWPRRNIGGNDTGAVQTYSRSGTTWSTDEYFYHASGGHLDFFGDGIGLYGDILVVGIAGRNEIVVYKRSGGTWSTTIAQTISGAYLAPASANAFNGYVLVGITGATSGNRTAKAYYYDGTNFAHRRDITPSDIEANDRFAEEEIAVSSTNLILVGAYGWDDPTYSDSGAAYTFDISGDIVEVDDEIGTQWFATVSVPESVSISEQITANVPKEAAISESVSVGDSLETHIVYPVEISESASVSELMDEEVTRGASISESVSVSDGIGALRTLISELSESASVGESIEAEIEIQLATVSESVSVSDGVVATVFLASPTCANCDVFCFGPGGEVGIIDTYGSVVLAGSYYIDAGPPDLVLYSDAGVESSMFVDASVPQNFTIRYVFKADNLPPDLSDVSVRRFFLGAWEDSGSSTGLFFSQSGIGIGAAVDEDIAILPDSAGVVAEGIYYTVLLVVDGTSDAVYIHLTKTEDILNGRAHRLRWIVSGPTQTGSHSEGVKVSVLGDSIHPTQVRVNGACLGTGALMPNQPPVADAGQEQEARLCTFVQLDGSNSYDPDGSALTYLWRLIDAPSDSAYVFEAYDGTTSPASPPTGYTNELSSTELETEHGETAIVAGDILLISGTPHRVSSVATGPFVITVTSQAIPDSLSQATVKLIRQADVFASNSVEKPIFYPDKPGFWKFDLTVNDGGLDSADRSVVVVHVKESLMATGVTPDVSFCWNYLSDFWRMIDDPEYLEAIWSGVAQIVGANLMALWQVDYNNSLRDIQRSMQRRWLYYDLLVQEPFVALTTVAKMDNTAGFLIGSDGSRAADRTYEIVSDLSSEDIQEGDFLVLDGLGYKISSYVEAGAGIPYNQVVTYEDFPAGITDYQIARPCSSTQINFYEGMVIEDDTAVIEVVTTETGEYGYFFVDVMGVSEAHPDKLMVDPTSVLSYLGDDTYDVYLVGVFRRRYVPINERIVDIPRLQQTIKDPPEAEVLHRGVDFFLETFRGLPCLRFADVWKYYDTNQVLQDDPTPPARLWAETTYIENLSTIESNFGILADFTLDDHADLPEDVDYLAAVKGLWYVHFNSPSLRNLRVGTQILLGLPFSEESGTIQEIRDDIVSPTNTIFILDDAENGIVRSYSYPADLALEVNPDTEAAYAVGDSISQFAPIVKGATVIDYKSDPAWFGKFVGQSVFSEVQKFHRFGLEIEQDAYTLSGALMARRLLLAKKPTYTTPSVIGKVDTGDHDIDINDTIEFHLKMHLFDGPCFHLGFGHARMWDEPDPSPMKMSSPPDGGSPEYDHERIPGVYGGWQSAYDEPASREWTEDFVMQKVGPPNITSTPVTVEPDEWSYEHATATIIWIVFRVEAPSASGHPDLYDASPLYEVALRKNSVDAFVYQIDLTGLWAHSGGVYFVERGVSVSPNVEISPTDELDVVVRPQGGCSNTPNWSLAYVRLDSTEMSYEGGHPAWGYDLNLCPRETIEAIICCVWAGGTPTFDNPLFAYDTPIYVASVVSGHVVLDTTPIPWTYDDTLPAGTYGRRVTL